MAVAAAARPRRSGDCLRGDRRGRGVSIRVRAPARRPRRAEPARSRQRAAASAGDRDHRRSRRHAERSVFAGAVECPCRARAQRRAGAEIRLAVAAGGAARSLCAARAGPHRLRRHLLCRRRRALEAHHRRVRLARRGAAGEFPGRCLGHSAGLYQQAAADLARHPSRRDRGTIGQRYHRRAGQFDAGRALDRQSQPHRFRHRRRDAGERCGARAGRHRRASLHHHRDRQRHLARRRRRSDLGVQCHSRQAADHRADQGPGAATPRLAAVVLPARRRLRGDRGAGDVRPQER